MIIEGYKIFNPDWTCKNKQYTCPGEFHEDVKPIPCESGMHFCTRLIDCLAYYPLETLTNEGEIIRNHVAKVSADKNACNFSEFVNMKNYYGSYYGSKIVTSDLKIIKELSENEIVETIKAELKVFPTFRLILFNRLIFGVLYYLNCNAKLRDNFGFPFTEKVIDAVYRG